MLLTYGLQPFLLELQDVQLELGPQALRVEDNLHNGSIVSCPKVYSLQQQDHLAAEAIKVGQLHVVDE